MAKNEGWRWQFAKIVRKEGDVEQKLEEEKGVSRVDNGGNVPGRGSKRVQKPALGTGQSTVAV